MRDASSQLPLSHRLSIIYITAPVVIWLLGWFEWWIGVPVTACLIMGLWNALSGSWRFKISLKILVPLLTALAWILLVPVGGMWKSSIDLSAHYTVMLDMSRGEWPTYLTDHLDGNPPLLGYYMGWIMVPGLIGKWLGTTSLSWVVPLYNWFGIGLLLIMFTRGLPTVRASLIAMTSFIFFSGADILEHITRNGLSEGLQLIFNRLGRNEHLEFETYNSQLQDYVTSLNMEYLSNSSILRYSTHHFIASGLGLLIIIQSRHRLRFAAVSGLVITVCLFWSPLGAIGLLLPTAALIVQSGIRPFLKWPNLLTAPPIIALIALFLLSNDTSTHSGWLWQYYTSTMQMIIDLLILYLAEFVLLVLLIWRLDKRIIKGPMFIAILTMLVIAPWYVIGSPHYENDLALRVTIPALVALSYYTSRTLISRLPEMQAGAQADYPQTASSTHSPSPLRLHVLLISMLMLGAVTASFVFLKSANRTYAVYERVGNTYLASNLNDRKLSERIITTVPGFLQILLRDHDQKGLPIGEPIVHSKYEIYLHEQDRMLVYLNRNCIPELERSTRFYMRIYPTNINAVGHKVSKDRYELFENEFIDRGNQNCIGQFSLPGYDISNIVVGQYTPYLGKNWEIAYRLKEDKTPSLFAIDYPTELHPPLYSYYQLVAGEAPLISSTFDIHLVPLHQNTLIYTKDPCSRQDTLIGFFLHIIPDDTKDLPEDIQQAGRDFDNLDFQFDEFGVRFDGKCLAVVPIPDYSIAAIRTGQFDSLSDLNLWQEEITLKGR